MDAVKRASGRIHAV